MNSLWSKGLRAQLRAAIQDCTGESFQSLIIELMRSRYGIENVQDIRSQHDQGADCLIREQGACIACYGWKGDTARDRRKRTQAFNHKLQSDYKKYQSNWQASYPKWWFCINSEPSPNEIQAIDRLATPKNRCELFGLERLIALIDELPSGKQYHIFRLLEIDSELIGRDFLKNLFNDLLNIDSVGPSVHYPSSAPNITAKLILNCPEESARMQIQVLLRNFWQEQLSIENLLAIYDETELEAIKKRVIRDFNSFIGVTDFSTQFQLLIQKYTAQYDSSEDDIAQNYITGFVGYLFTQCLIGESPLAEKG